MIAWSTPDDVVSLVLPRFQAAATAATPVSAQKAVRTWYESQFSRSRPNPAAVLAASTPSVRPRPHSTYTPKRPAISRKRQVARASDESRAIQLQTSPTSVTSGWTGAGCTTSSTRGPTKSRALAARSAAILMLRMGEAPISSVRSRYRWRRTTSQTTVVATLEMMLTCTSEVHHSSQPAFFWK